MLYNFQNYDLLVWEMCVSENEPSEKFGENPLQSSTVKRANHYAFIKHRNDRLSLIITFKPKIFDRPSRFTPS